jgi:hypothetical protein
VNEDKGGVHTMDNSGLYFQRGPKICTLRLWIPGLLSFWRRGKRGKAPNGMEKQLYSWVVHIVSWVRHSFPAQEHLIHIFHEH